MERGRSAPATPIPPLDLVRLVEELRGLLREVAGPADVEHLWGLSGLRVDVDRALRSPVALGSAQNQVDLVEALADAVWEATEAGLGGCRLAAARARLEHLADDLAERVDTWRRRRSALES